MDLDIHVPPRRVKRLTLTADLLLGWWKSLDGTPQRVTCSGIPADAKVSGVAAQTRPGDGLGPNVITLLVESEEFEPVAEGAHIPDFTPEFRRDT